MALLKILSSYCVLALGLAQLQNSDDIAVLYQGQTLKNFDQIAVANRLFGDLNLQCISPAGGDLVWTSQELNQELVILQQNGPAFQQEDEYISVWYGRNTANITIRNLLSPYRGTLRCSVPSLGESVTIFVTESSNTVFEYCEGGDVDATYGIRWNRAALNTTASESCPRPGDLEVRGLAFRECEETGEWASTVDTTSCFTPEFQLIRLDADTIFLDFESLDNSTLNFTFTELIDDLVNLTTPSTAISMLPQDLNDANYILENIIQISSTDSLYTDAFQVIDNLLAEVNMDGWRQLDRIAGGSRQLLKIIEAFEVYVLSAQAAAQIRNTVLNGAHFVLSAVTFDSSSRGDVAFPHQESNSSREGLLRIPARLLVNSTGVVNGLVRNLAMFLPQLDRTPENKRRVASSVLLSTQVSYSNQVEANEEYSLLYNTTEIARSDNPLCYIWNGNGTDGEWVRSGVETDTVRLLQGGEFKSFNVECSARLGSAAIAVIVEQETEVFDFTYPVYIGCGVVIFAALLSVFILLCSCVVNRKRTLSMAANFTHMSLCISLICSFVAFLALRIEAAITHEIGCITISAVLHYFFTATFSWLFCEVLLLIFFSFYSKHCSAFILLFLLGWALPAIPAAISLGLFREEYVTSQRCWFYFDGMLQNRIVLAFVLPKILIFASTLVALLINCCVCCRCGKNLPKNTIKLNRIIRLLWFGDLLLLLLLGVAWVFALLLVSVLAVSQVVSGWVFMAACIALGVCLLFVFTTSSIMSHNVNFWSGGGDDPISKKKEPMRPQYESPGEYEMEQRQPFVVVNPLAQVDEQTLQPATAEEEQDSPIIVYGDSLAQTIIENTMTQVQDHVNEEDGEMAEIQPQAPDLSGGVNGGNKLKEDLLALGRRLLVIIAVSISTIIEPLTLSKEQYGTGQRERFSNGATRDETAEAHEVGVLLGSNGGDETRKGPREEMGMEKGDGVREGELTVICSDRENEPREVEDEFREEGRGEAGEGEAVAEEGGADSEEIVPEREENGAGEENSEDEEAEGKVTAIDDSDDDSFVKQDLSTENQS